MVIRLAEAVNSMSRDSHEVAIIGGHGTLYGKGPVVHKNLNSEVAFTNGVPPLFPIIYASLGLVYRVVSLARFDDDIGHACVTGYRDYE